MPLAPLDKEKFLKELKALLQPTGTVTPEQQAIADAVYASVEAKLAQGGSSVKDVFDAMQTVAKTYKAQMDAIVQRNQDEADKVNDELNNKKARTDAKVAISGKAEIDAIGQALTHVLSQTNLETIAKKAQDAGLTSTSEQPLTIDTSYSASTVREVVRDVKFENGKNGQTAPLSQKGKKSSESNSIFDDRAAFPKFVVRGDLVKMIPKKRKHWVESRALPYVLITVFKLL